MTKVLPQVEIHPVVLKLTPVLNLTDDQLFELCELNRDWRIEYTAQGELIVMPPTGGETGNRNAEITFQVQAWARQDRTGAAFDSSGGFKLPNGATRSPDAAWVRRARLAVLTSEQKQKFLPLCPDFVIELRSPTDNLQAVQDKMQEYLDNGAQLGWLIDPLTRRVHVYLPHRPPELLEAPNTVSADPILPGFVLDLQKIWQPEL
ncbi:MAG TPA: Uma2 family endonuclease [Candidatus Tectomicrobia bacterium]|nr:Uma2 family endonuclease [Candidatus Tectomicrobia bacterium]